MKAPLGERLITISLMYDSWLPLNSWISIWWLTATRLQQNERADNSRNLATLRRKLYTF